MAHWDEDAQHRLEDWRGEVENDDTRLGYWEWVAVQRGRPACARIADDEVITGEVWTRFLEQEYQLDRDHPGEVSLAAIVGELRRLAAAGDPDDD
ncbi:MAG: hypothetical protein U0S13_08375 [Mycobacterium sp.]